jgi:formate hydrogenlyase subunit 3/multisubunit Na+/H+ antiporter MnhD subunit
MASAAGASLLLFFVSCACGLLLSVVVGRRHSGVVIGMAGALASLFIMLAAAAVLVTGRNFEASLWVLQGLGPFTLRLDMLSSVFLLSAGLVYFSASLFVRSFVDDQFGGRYPARRFGVMYFALMASVGLILVANDAPLFLISWECMSILCFLFLNYEQLGSADTSIGYIMLAMSDSSIENAGIIVAGLGAFLIYRASGHPVASAIALTAALYHMLNHSIYKTLLFQGTGYVEAAAGTRDMDQLGGLSRLLPGLSAIFLVGCLAISAVPPFNGFVSEWMTLQALLRSAVLSSAPIKIVFALCGAALALTAALAVTCFVKVYAMSFLGIRRGSWEPHLRAHAGSRFPLGFLAVVCLLLGILPTYIIPVLNRAVEPLTTASATASLIPPFFTANSSNQQLPPAFLQDFHDLGAQSGSRVLPGRGLVILLRGSAENPVVFAMSPSYSLAALAILLLLAWFVFMRLTRRRATVRRELWAGGIPKLFPEMTYTATGFSNPVRVVFQAVFRPNITEDTRQTVAVHFRTAIRRQRDETHMVDRLFFRPVSEAMNGVAKFLAGMHHGHLNVYVAYVLGFLLTILFLYRAS